MKKQLIGLIEKNRTVDSVVNCYIISLKLYKMGHKHVTTFLRWQLNCVFVHKDV